VRIVSLLPSATEIVCSLGLIDSLVGITHACDYPAEIVGKAVVTRSRLPPGLTSPQIDQAVAEAERSGQGVYELDLGLLRALEPELILTQGLCDVCAVSHGQVRQAVPALASKPQILSFSPLYLADVLSNVKTVGDFTGSKAAGRKLITALRTQADRVALKTARARSIPRVFCLEWLDPPWTAGHWVPEMVGLAGGHEGLTTPGVPSGRVTWEQVAAYEPEIIIAMPCGFDLRQTVEEFGRTVLPELWHELPAVRSGQVWAVDASAYFNRPGPRLYTGLEILASIIQPDRHRKRLPPGAAARLGQSASSG
jgi:iron complex transport system substrate-binding protein